MIRIDAVWMALAPLDMRAGMDTTLARVITVFGAAQPHHAYLFANRRANRMKVLVHDGIGIWLASRRLYQGRFAWPSGTHARQCRCRRRNWMRWWSACRGIVLVRQASLRSSN